MNLSLQFITFLCLGIQVLGRLRCAPETRKFNRVIATLQKMGYTVEREDLVFVSNATHGGNPSSAYGVYSKTRKIDPNKIPQFKLEAESAYLFYGCTPPTSAYFSFRSYVCENDDKFEFASLGDSINQLVIETAKFTKTAPFDDVVTVVTTGDGQTFEDISRAMKDNNIQTKPNLDAIPDSLVTFGTEENGPSTFAELVRVAIPTNAADYKNYLSRVQPVYKIKLVGSTNKPRKPLPVPQLRSRLTGTNESDLHQSVGALEQSVLREMAKLGYNWKTGSDVAPYYLDGFNCIDKKEDCRGDNHDAAYYVDKNAFMLNDSNVVVVMGVNHNRANFTTYSNIGVYAYEEKIKSFVSTDYDVDNTQFDGSAEKFDMNIIDVEKLFAVVFARPNVCKQFAQFLCVSIPYDKLEKDDPMRFVARAYLNPRTKTGPSYLEIAQDTMFLFEKPSQV